MWHCENRIVRKLAAKELINFWVKLLEFALQSSNTAFIGFLFATLHHCFQNVHLLDDFACKDLKQVVAYQAFTDK